MILSHKACCVLLYNSLIIYIDYIEFMLSSLWLVCVVLILTAQEHWSEAGATKTKEAIIRYVLILASLVNSIVKSRERVIILSCFVLDPGGSREIGLCPHLRIYPITKLATPLGNGLFPS
jgi:hypothetical protein